MAAFYSSCEKDDEPKLSVPTLTTNSVTDITGTKATGGGEVSMDGNSPITAKGVCWSTSNNPTVDFTTKTDEGPGFHSFGAFITGLTDGTIYFVRAYATNGVGTAYGQEESFKTGAVVGEAFQGGILAYLFQAGDPGYVAGQRHGIVCTLSDFADQPWSPINTTTGATAMVLGSGQANTTAIVNNLVAGNYEARTCADLVVGVYSDWFLPSANELSMLYNNKVAIGNFNAQYYWSSTELDASSALRIDFLSGNTISNGKFNNHTTRPVLVFLKV